MFVCFIPQHERYLNVYKKYDDLLDNTAEQDISTFLNDKHDIDDFVTVRDATWSSHPGDICYSQFIEKSMFCYKHQA